MTTLGKLKQWREDRNAAHVAPLMCLLIVTTLLGFIGEKIEWKHPEAVWWKHWPDTWILGIAAVCTSVLIVFFWKHYEFKWNLKAVVIGAIMGAIGIGFWLLPTVLHDAWGLTENPESGWMKWFGINDRQKGLDPDEFGSEFWKWSWIALRVFRAVVIVSIVEEVLWRGFLMRFLLKPDRNYWKVPFGQASWKTYIIVTVIFMIAHAPVDYAGAIAFGTIMYGVAVYTKSLLACVVMHGVANFLMCWYALETGKFGLL